MEVSLPRGGEQTRRWPCLLQSRTKKRPYRRVPTYRLGGRLAAVVVPPPHRRLPYMEHRIQTRALGLPDRKQLGNRLLVRECRPLTIQKSQCELREEFVRSQPRTSWRFL